MNIRVVLCKKPLEKITNIREMREFCKVGHLAKPIAHGKAIAFAKWSVWVQKLKMSKTCEKPFNMNNRFVLCKKPLEKKKQIFEK